MKPFDFERWKGVIDKDNHADDYYEAGDDYVYCWSCGNLMVPTGGDHFKCPVCGEEWEKESKRKDYEPSKRIAFIVYY